MLAEIIVAMFLVVGGVFGLVGSFGLVRLPETMTRLHAPTKATTLGVGGVLLASMVGEFVLHGRITWHELLITLFLFLTAPVSAMFIAKVRLHGSQMEPQVPAPAQDHRWATFAPESPADGG